MNRRYVSREHVADKYMVYLIFVASHDCVSGV